MILHRLDSATSHYREKAVTHYGKAVENNRLQLMFERLMLSSSYESRRKEIEAFNARNETRKRGIALTPIKFGISFTTSFLNQAGALVNIYQDGTVTVNHGGTEMGQGLHTKMKQVAAKELGISAEFVRVESTNTGKIPNTSATAASSGSDLNGMAIQLAVTKLKTRLSEVAATLFAAEYKKEIKAEDIVFGNDKVSSSTYLKSPFPFLN
ncbi:MAG: molybdopterin-dependent oxidoreductase [Bacteroidales bacterium]|nr:molybdopterin-dependent oxidoreductase [Bacteroidales bacterium]